MVNKGCPKKNAGFQMRKQSPIEQQFEQQLKSWQGFTCFQRVDIVIKRERGYRNSVFRDLLGIVDLF